MFVIVFWHEDSRAYDTLAVYGFYDSGPAAFDAAQAIPESEGYCWIVKPVGNIDDTWSQ